MGNICRSPTAEGVFSHVVKNNNLQELIHIDSAGTHAYHVGEKPDPRAQQTARERGIDLSQQRARRVSSEDFYAFDYILALKTVILRPDPESKEIFEHLYPTRDKNSLDQIKRFT